MASPVATGAVVGDLWSASVPGSAVNDCSGTRPPSCCPAAATSARSRSACSGRWPRPEIVPDLIVGCSVGAINGAAFAAEPDQRGVDRLDRIWRRIADGEPDLMPSKRLPVLAQMARRGQSLHDPGPLAELLDDELPTRTFSGLRIPFTCVATDVDTADEHWFDAGRLLPALLASAALPVVYPAVEHGAEDPDRRRGAQRDPRRPGGRAWGDRASTCSTSATSRAATSTSSDPSTARSGPTGPPDGTAWRTTSAASPSSCVVHRLPAGSNAPAPLRRLLPGRGAGRPCLPGLEPSTSGPAGRPVPVSGPVSDHRLRGRGRPWSDDGSVALGRRWPSTSGRTTTDPDALDRPVAGTPGPCSAAERGSWTPDDPNDPEATGRIAWGIGATPQVVAAAPTAERPPGPTIRGGLRSNEFRCRGRSSGHNGPPSPALAGPTRGMPMSNINLTPSGPPETVLDTEPADATRPGWPRPSSSTARPAPGRGGGRRGRPSPLPRRLGPPRRPGPGSGRGLRRLPGRLPPGPRPPPPERVAGLGLRPLEPTTRTGASCGPSTACGGWRPRSARRTSGSAATSSCTSSTPSGVPATSISSP